LQLTDILEYIEAQDKECFEPFQAAYFILMFLLQVAIKDDGLKSQLQEAMDLLMNGYLPERIKQYEKVKQMLNKLLNNIKDEHTNTTNSQIAAGARKCKRAL